MTAITDLAINFGAAGTPQPITIAEQLYAGMAVGFGAVMQSRWRSNVVVVGGINFTLFPGIDSDGRVDCWVYAAYGEASVANVDNGINRQHALVDLQISVLGVAQPLFGGGTTYSYDHQRATWLRWQSTGMVWDTSHAFIEARVVDGTFLRHDSRGVFGSSEDITSGIPGAAAYQPFKTFCAYAQDTFIGDVPRAATGGGERTSIGPVHEWFARLITEIGTNSNPSWLTGTRLQILKDLAETAGQFPHASGLVEPVTNRLLDPSVKPHCSHGNPAAWYGATGIPQPGSVGGANQYNCEYDNPHPLNKFSFQAYHLSKDPFHLLQVQGQAVCALTFQSLFGIGRGGDGKTLMIGLEQERGLWWGLQMLVQAWHATPAGTMPKPFRDKAWFAAAIDNTLQFLRDHYMNSTNHIEAGIKGEAMRFWRAVGNMGTVNGEFYNSRFQEDYGHIVMAQALMLGYVAARDVAEWRVVNMKNRIALAGSWFLNDYALENATNPQLSAYALSPDTGSLPYTDIAGFKAWYPRKTLYANGPTVGADYWHQQFGRDTYLFIGAVNITKEAVARGLMTAGFDVAAAETELRARFVPPYTQPNSTNALNYGIYAKQYFSYQGTATVTLPADNYSVASGQPMYIGRAAPVGAAYTFNKSSIVIAENGGSANPYDSYFAGQIASQTTATGKKPPLIMSLHGSSGGTWTNGRLYTVPVDGAMAFTEDNSFQFSLVTMDVRSEYSTYGDYGIELRPFDLYSGAGATTESSHIGFVRSDGKFHLISEHRYDALIDYVDDPTNTDMAKYDLRRRIARGGSMGAWGVITYAIRRWLLFAAIYADRPRWHFGSPYGQVNLTVWGSGKTNYPSGTTPLLAAEDGTGSAEDYTNMIAYVSNTANKVRPVLWCGGRQDPYYDFQDYVNAVAALRAAKRFFVFAWNNGDHSTGSVMNQIYASYPVGTFSRDQGYPLFTSHSLDQDPAVDLVGMINGNLAFRGVVETANGWSCEVTSIAAACTVMVEPISEVFIKSVAKQLVTIPAANTWVAVSFT